MKAIGIHVDQIWNVLYTYIPPDMFDHPSHGGFTFTNTCQNMGVFLRELVMKYARPITADHDVARATLLRHVPLPIEDLFCYRSMPGL